MFATAPASIEFVKAGKLRALAVTTATRLAALPDIASVGEFVPGYEASGFYGLGAPKHAARDHRQAQQGDQRQPRRSQDEGADRRDGRHGAGGIARRVRKLIAEETDKWGKVIRAANIKPD